MTWVDRKGTDNVISKKNTLKSEINAISTPAIIFPLTKSN
jgi:hypothetical protein